ncbi:MAG: DUF4399 domain-containing protein [Hyphomicrobiales bacterium]
MDCAVHAVLYIVRIRSKMKFRMRLLGGSMRQYLLALVFAPFIFHASALAEPSPQGAKVYIVWPKDGTVIKGGKFWLRMGLTGMGVAPAGTVMPGTGHHHVIVDSELPAMDEPIPNDPNHLHFGKGQTEARIELPPGSHTLQLLFGDVKHIPHSPPLYSKKITITVP